MPIAESISDHELMLAVRDGDLDSLGDLFERHHGALFGFLYKLIGNRSSAEDVAQVVFQRMLKYRHTYRDTGSFTAWMYHLARRCTADHFRKASSAPAAVDPADLSIHPDSSPAIPDTAVSREDQAMLQAALLRLDPAEREVLLLSRLQELSFAEVAEVLECSIGAARVRAHRALQSLREQFFQLQQRSTS